MSRTRDRRTSGQRRRNWLDSRLNSNRLRRSFDTALLPLAAANATDVRGQAVDTKADPGIFFQPLPNAFHALSSCQSGIDLRPQRPDLSRLCDGLFRTALCEATASQDDPIPRFLRLVRVRQEKPIQITAQKAFFGQNIPQGQIGLAAEIARSGWKNRVEPLVRKSTVAAIYDALRQIAAVFQRRGSLR